MADGTVSDGLNKTVSWIFHVIPIFCNTIVVQNMEITERFPGFVPKLALPTIWIGFQVNLVTKVLLKCRSYMGDFVEYHYGKVMLFKQTVERE